ncbi:hypothetical protein [Chryseobacterium sp. WX]|uniref:hypothetical protein n=1 Tax=Chryseobacterium sp. WX TaxID=3031803 RepID=UPI0024091095|nr:hypothetical protein [Chryseobacterium sp. WX]WFB68212.1 hypothetical protein PZ898_02135 [Chryseobacterium sp. WX]
MDFGNKLYRTVKDLKLLIFDIGEKIALSKTAFSFYRDNIKATEKGIVTITTPLGLDYEDEVIEHEYEYSYSELKLRINELCIDQLAIDGIYKMVTSVESVMVAVLDVILQKYPAKISNKIKIDSNLIFEVQSLEELKTQLFKRIINELTYKSPEDFAKDFKDYTSVDLNKCDDYERYIELKATRDLYMHNDGIVNEIYLRKAKKLARAKEKSKIICDYNYFLKSYEVCFKVVEYIIEELNKKWKSSEYEEWKNRVDNKVKINK